MSSKFLVTVFTSRDYAAAIVFNNENFNETVQLGYAVYFNTSFTHALPTTIHAVNDIFLDFYF